MTHFKQDFGVQSIYQVTRELKKQDNNVFNCVHSCLADRTFVEEICSLYKGVPVFANLRCGLWYTREDCSTCYFKSTDGHNGNWSFSCTRLNWHVAETAAREGGAIVVDATRSSVKNGFPDAFSKTCPIWAAVLNRAVARVRAAHALPPPPLPRPMQRRPVLPGWLDSSLDDPQQAETRQADLGGGTPPWPAASSPPHRHVSSVDEGDRSSGGLPCSGSSSCGSSHHATCIISPGGSPCVATSAEAQSSPQELSSHSATPSEWISEVEWDTSLHLPLWVSENERKQIEARMEGWVESLLAVGADVKGLAQVMAKPLRCLWISPASCIWVDAVAQPCDLPFTPIFLLSASSPRLHERRQRPLAGSQQAGSASGAGKGSDAAVDEDACPTFTYIPGAGDDEESWAHGLTPALLAQHQMELEAAGPSNITAVVQSIVGRQRQRTHHDAPRHAAGEAAGARSAHGQAAAHGQTTASKVAPKVATDEHHLLPQGCQPPPGPLQLHCVGHGLYALGGTRVFVGAGAAGAPPAVWEAVGAVLNVGAQQHAGMEGEQEPHHSAGSEAAGPAGGAAEVAAVARDVPTQCTHLSSEFELSSEVGAGTRQGRSVSAPASPATSPPGYYSSTQGAHPCTQSLPDASQPSFVPGEALDGQQPCVELVGEGGAGGDTLDETSPFATGFGGWYAKCALSEGTNFPQPSFDAAEGAAIQRVDSFMVAAAKELGLPPPEPVPPAVANVCNGTNSDTAPAPTDAPSIPITNAVPITSTATNATTIPAAAATATTIATAAVTTTATTTAHPSATPATTTTTATRWSAGPLQDLKGFGSFVSTGPPSLQPPGTDAQGAAARGAPSGSPGVTATGAGGDSQAEACAQQPQQGAQHAQGDDKTSVVPPPRGLTISVRGDTHHPEATTAPQPPLPSLPPLPPSAARLPHTSSHSALPSDGSDVVTVFSLEDAFLQSFPTTPGTNGGSSFTGGVEHSLCGSAGTSTAVSPHGPDRAQVLAFGKAVGSSVDADAVGTSEPSFSLNGALNNLSQLRVGAGGGQPLSGDGGDAAQGGNSCGAAGQGRAKDTTAGASTVDGPTQFLLAEPTLVPPAAHNNEQSFEFAPPTAIHDITPPDYISIPLRVSQAERASMRRAVEARDREASQPMSPTRYCLMPWAVMGPDGAHLMPGAVEALQRRVAPPLVMRAGDVGMGNAVPVPVIRRGAGGGGARAAALLLGGGEGLGVGAGDDGEAVVMGQVGTRGVMDVAGVRQGRGHHRRANNTESPSLLTSALQRSGQAGALQRSGQAGALLDSPAAAAAPDAPTRAAMAVCNQHEHRGAACGSQTYGRYLWHPIANSKVARAGLSDALPHVLPFLSHHLAAGRPVLIHDDDGLDQSVCVALALLLACYAPAAGSRGPGAGEGSGEGGGLEGSGSPTTSLQFMHSFSVDPVTGVPCAAEPVTKHLVRKRLAFVASCYPQARPTRGMLKQVFNFFQSNQHQFSDEV